MAIGSSALWTDQEKKVCARLRATTSSLVIGALVVSTLITTSRWFGAGSLGSAHYTTHAAGAGSGGRGESTGRPAVPGGLLVRTADVSAVVPGDPPRVPAPRRPERSARPAPAPRWRPPRHG